MWPLSGSVTRRASGSSAARRAASPMDGSSRSAADAMSSVGTLQCMQRASIPAHQSDRLCAGVQAAVQPRSMIRCGRRTVGKGLAVKTHREARVSGA